MSSNHHTPHNVNDPLTAVGLNVPLGELDQAITDTLAGTVAITQLNLGADTTLTLVAGAVTVTQTRHLIATEGGTISDDLTTISGSVDGDILIIGIANADEHVIVKHDTGNIRLWDGQHRVLAKVQEYLFLIFDTTQSRWLEPSPEQPRFGFAKNQIKLYPDSAAGVSVTGAAATITANSFAQRNQSDTTYIELQTSTSANNRARVFSASLAIIETRYDPTIEILIQTDEAAVTTLRYWLGLFSTEPTADDPGGQLAAFRFSTAAADVGWIPTVKDGATLNAGAAIGTVVADTTYKLKIRVDDAASAIMFSVDDSPETIVTANLPSNSQNLGFYFGVETLDTSARDLLFARALIEYN